jgi:hypothetical protein
MKSPHHHRRVGEVYYHAGEMWRRGVGIIYAAHPCVRGLIYESLKRRWKRRSRSFFAGHFGPKRVSPSTSRWLRRREERRDAAKEDRFDYEHQRCTCDHIRLVHKSYRVPGDPTAQACTSLGCGCKCFEEARHEVV